jgi:lipoyl(octanoyl) transferase
VGGEGGSASRDALVIRRLGRVEYEPTWRAMQAFTAARDDASPDELWLLEHPPVYTLGQAGKPEHLIAPTSIPLVQIDRGGQITYHGPGQIVVYLLVDLKRRGYGIRELVVRIEQAIIDLLATHSVTAERRAGAPGVYVDDAKIAALGLRVKQGRTYHGLALNVAMDLSPFAAINPCGYAGMAVTQCRDLGVTATQQGLAEQLAKCLSQNLVA